MCHLSIFLSSPANTLISPKSCHCGLEYLQCKRHKKWKIIAGKNISKLQSSKMSLICQVISSSALQSKCTIGALQRNTFRSCCCNPFSAGIVQQRGGCQIAACLMQRWDAFLTAECRRVSEEAALCVF